MIRNQGTKMRKGGEGPRADVIVKRTMPADCCGGGQDYVRPRPDFSVESIERLEIEPPGG